MDNRVEANYVVIAWAMVDNHNKIASQALIELGATDYVFIDNGFAKHHNLALFAGKQPRPLTFIDLQPLITVVLTQLTKIWWSIYNHHQFIATFVTILRSYHLPLGIPWLKHHDVKINHASNLLTSESEYCLKNCVNKITMAYCIEEELPQFLLAYGAQCPFRHQVLNKD